MKTPDGREFKGGITGNPLGAAAAASAAVGRLLWGATVWLGRAIGKVIATIWRLAGALDAALWRGVKLFARQAWRVSVMFANLVLAASRDVLRWLPSRSGRAYSAFSGFWLVIMLLWMIDEIRVSPDARPDDGSRPRAPIDLEDPILARIEGRYVHLSEVMSAARAAGALRPGETLTPQTAFERELVQSYVEQRLLARAALDAGLHRDQQVARKLSAARDRILAASYIEQEIAATVTDDLVNRLYERQADVTRLGDEVRARHIVVASREEADAIMTALAAGGEFAAMARELSLDRATAPLGGEIGYFTEDMMTPQLAGAAFATPVGEIATPFESEFGWHVLEVLDRRETEGVPLAAVKDDIRRFLRMRTIASTLAALKEDEEVVYYSSEPIASPAAAPRLREGASP